MMTLTLRRDILYLHEQQEIELIRKIFFLTGYYWKIFTWKEESKKYNNSSRGIRACVIDYSFKKKKRKKLNFLEKKNDQFMVIIDWKTLVKECCIQ